MSQKLSFKEIHRKATIYNTQLEEILTNRREDFNSKNKEKHYLLFKKCLEELYRCKLTKDVHYEYVTSLILSICISLSNLYFLDKQLYDENLFEINNCVRFLFSLKDNEEFCEILADTFGVFFDYNFFKQLEREIDLFINDTFISKLKLEIDSEVINLEAYFNYFSQVFLSINDFYQQYTSIFTHSSDLLEYFTKPIVLWLTHSESTFYSVYSPGNLEQFSSFHRFCFLNKENDLFLEQCYSLLDIKGFIDISISKLSTYKLIDINEPFTNICKSFDYSLIPVDLWRPPLNNVLKLLINDYEGTFEEFGEIIHWLMILIGIDEFLHKSIELKCVTLYKNDLLSVQRNIEHFCLGYRHLDIALKEKIVDVIDQFKVTKLNIFGFLNLEELFIEELKSFSLKELNKLFETERSLYRLKQKTNFDDDFDKKMGENFQPSDDYVNLQLVLKELGVL
eukprot:TRINITY_DN1373_c0_g1_i1.p1 TRINITY_DN1373_c0_g1~~TRINITY_DN1373_c0_g1_i1.p1  ORF type:complete len:452 (+),score=121.50 TRINITY_DN1373_c0_g1_i1:37-1392(+)